MRRPLALLMLALTLVLGCSSGKPLSPKRVTGLQVTSGAPATIKLGVLAGWIASPGLDAVIAAFQDKYPAYRVETVKLAADSEVVFQAMSKGDVDLIQGGSGHLVKALTEGVIADLTPYLASSGVSPSAFDWFLDSMRDQGKVLELPYAVNPMGVVYNRDLARAAGVTIPETGWTWDQFRDIAQRISKQDGDSHTWGFFTDSAFIPVSVWVKQAGGPPQNRPSADSLADALHYFSDLIFADRSMAPPPSWDGKGEPPEYFFGAGKAALTIGSLSNARSGQALPFEMGFAPIPNLPGARPVLYVEASSLAMNGKAPNPEGAWQFLKFLTGSDAAMVLAAAGDLPCYPSEEAKLLWLHGRPELPKSVQSLLDAQWITMGWYLTDRNQDGMIVIAADKAFATETGWESAVSMYVRKAKAAGIH